MRKRSCMAAALMLGFALSACAGPSAGGPVNSGGQNGEAADKPDTMDTSDTVVSDAGSDNAATDNTAGSTEAEGEQSGVIQEVSEQNWKEAYLEFLDDYLYNEIGLTPGDDEGWSCGFIYVNDDDIPEMVIDSGFEAAGRMIVTYAGGKAQALQNSRMGFLYVPRGNVIDNADGIMGYNYHYFYNIDPEKGFVIKDSGIYTEKVNEETGVSEGFEYAWNDETVTKEEFEKNIADNISAKDSLSFYCGTRIDNVRDYLSGNGPKDYKEAYMNLYNNGFVSSFADGNYPAYAVLDSKDSDPMLLASSQSGFSLCYFEDGLLTVGPEWYVSSYETALMLPDERGFMTFGSYADESYFNSVYEVGDGCLKGRYYAQQVRYDENGEFLTDQNGDPVYDYLINNLPVDKKEYLELLDRYEDVFKIEYTPYDADQTYLDYISGDALEHELSSR